MNVLIIIPAYNEEASIVGVVDNLIMNYPQYDYLVVNDGSADQTAKICKKEKYNFLDLPINLGLAGAFQAGMRYAYEHEYDVAIQLDGDGQHNPVYIKEMLNVSQMEAVDIVIGSRFLENSKRKASLRHMGSMIIQTCIKLTTGVSLFDPTSGMRLYNKNMLKAFAYNMNFTPEPDTISYLLRCGIKVKEVSVEMQDRQAGESYLDVKFATKYMVHMCFSILLIQLFRRKEGFHAS